MIKLLSTNAKLDKRIDGVRYLINGLALAPHRRSGVNLCENAGFCSVVCNLWYSGRTVTRTVRAAMLARSKFMLTDPVSFEIALNSELSRFAKLARRKKYEPLVRLNVASDIDWRRIVRRHPDITFYDYSKIANRIRAAKRDDWPQNYELTYSWSERAHHRTAGHYLRSGRNVSVVLDTVYKPQHHVAGILPRTWRIDGTDWPVVDGDKHDIRLRKIDGHGKIIALRFKGSRKSKLFVESIRHGFTQRAPDLGVMEW